MKAEALDIQTTQNNSSDSQLEKGTAIPNSVPKAKQKRAPRNISPLTGVSAVPAYCQMLFDTFMRAWIPFDELGPSEQHNFLQILADLPSQPPVLTTAIQAVSLSKIGKVNHDEYLGKQSLRHYTVGLRELQKALNDPKQMHSDATLAACLLLALYELVECPTENKHAYTIHTEGCARLIQLRGPKAHRKGLAHSLFLAIRPQCVSSLVPVSSSCSFANLALPRSTKPSSATSIPSAPTRTGWRSPGPINPNPHWIV